MVLLPNSKHGICQAKNTILIKIIKNHVNFLRISKKSSTFVPEFAEKAQKQKKIKKQTKYFT